MTEWSDLTNEQQNGDLMTTADIRTYIDASGSAHTYFGHPSNTTGDHNYPMVYVIEENGTREVIVYTGKRPNVVVTIDSVVKHDTRG